MSAVGEHPKGTETRLGELRTSGQPVLPSEGSRFPKLSDLLNRHMGRAGMSTDTLFELIGLNRSTGYRILNGQRWPGRDVLIALAFALGLNEADTQALIKVGRKAILSPRDDRDSLILFAVMHGHSLGDANELLSEHGHEALCTRKNGISME